jgi:flagellar motor switch protein FliG
MSPLRKAALLVVSLDEPTAARLLARLDRSEVEAVTLEMARLDAVEPDQQRAVLEEFAALGMRRLRFQFDDVARLADRDIRDAYDDEDAPTWALALAGAPRALRSRVLGALRTDSARALERRLTLMGPFRLDDAEAAQADLAERLRRLHDQGRISLPDPEENGDILV